MMLHPNVTPIKPYLRAGRPTPKPRRPAQVIQLAAPCCLPCAAVRPGHTVYNRHGEAFDVRAVSREAGHVMLSLAVKFRGSELPLPFPACDPFSRFTPTRPTGRATLSPHEVVYQPLKDWPGVFGGRVVLPMLSGLRETDPDYRAGDLVTYQCACCDYAEHHAELLEIKRVEKWDRTFYRLRDIASGKHRKADEKTCRLTNRALRADERIGGAG